MSVPAPNQHADAHPAPERERDEGEYDEDELEEDEDDDDDDDDTITCVAVDPKYKLSRMQLARYHTTYAWFNHDTSTGKSWCSTCKRWEGPSIAMNGLVPEPPVATPTEPTAMDRVCEEAKKEKAFSRLPHALAALQLGKKGRPARDFPDTLAMVEKSAAALGATRMMEATHRDEHFARELWGKMSEQIGAEKRAQIRASPVVLRLQMQSAGRPGKLRARTLPRRSRRGSTDHRTRR